MSDQMPDFGQDPKAAKAAAKAYAKASRPAYKKKRFIIPAVFVAIIAAQSASGGGDGDTTEIKTASTETTAEAPAAPAAAPAKPEPAAAEPAMVVSAKEMIEVLEGNALKAKNTYKGKRVTVSGFVGNIDASGKYFSLDPEPDAFILTGVQVRTGKEFLDQVADFSAGQAVTVTGEISDVGEIMGYSLKAESIK